MAPQIGESLREARTRQGIELADAQAATKIRARFLNAMEAERWELLPGPAYARGFLHTYAEFLGLDADALVKEYAQTLKPADQPATDEPQADSLTEPLVTHAPGAPRRPLGASPAMLAALAAAAIVGFLVILGLTVGSDNGGRGEGQKKQSAAHTNGGGASTSKAPASETTTTQPAQVSVRLDPTGTVWVCLVDSRGRDLVDGETLTAGEARGPFQAQAFKVTFGNGEIDMDVNGKPFDVPLLAEPQGFGITSQGVQELSSAELPSCV